MVKYVSRVKQRLGSFLIWKLEHVPRDYNDKVDALATVATSLPITETIFLPIYYQQFSSITTLARENSLMKGIRPIRYKSSKLDSP